MANFIVGIISLTLGVVVLSGVFITTVKGTNTTGWTAGEVALTERTTGLLEVVGSPDYWLYSWSKILSQDESTKSLWSHECLWPCVRSEVFLDEGGHTLSPIFYRREVSIF